MIAAKWPSNIIYGLSPKYNDTALLFILTVLLRTTLLGPLEYSRMQWKISERRFRHIMK